MYTNYIDHICEKFVSNLSISDHFPVCFTRAIRSKKTSNQNHATITYRSFKNFNVNSFEDDLHKRNIYEVETISDPNNAINMLYDRLNSVLDTNAPLKTKRIKYVT